MANSRFDRYGDTYEEAVDRSISFAGQEHDFYIEAKARALVDLAARTLGDPASLRALDVGCGPGTTDRHLAGRIGEVAGVDVSDAMVERAAAENPDVAYRVYDGRTLPFDEAEFDLVFAINVLHHVDPPDRPGLVAEMARVTRPGGIVTVFEHNPLNPLTRLVVSRCEFDEGVELVRVAELRRLLETAGLEPVEQRFILFFPRRSKTLDRLERRLGRVPLGAQYLVATRRPPTIG
jgi:SAM-dependent methyltransferase